MNPITVLLADDNKVVRDGFKKILDPCADFKVIGEAKDGVQAVRLARRLRPAIVLMDVSMPRLNGFEATRQILEAEPAAKVLMLSAYGDEAYIEAAIDAGAMGYLIKQLAGDKVSTAIRTVQAGIMFFSASISPSLTRKCRKAKESSHDLAAPT